MSSRWKAAIALRTAFDYPNNRTQAWRALHNLIADEDEDVRFVAAIALRTVFGYIPDKTQAWHDLHKLTDDKYSFVRWDAAIALRTVFSYIPDKTQAWQDLLRLTDDADSYVRSEASRALGDVFVHAPDKTQAWQDLHSLTDDKDRFVRSGSARALGDAFGYIPDKARAWQDLHRLVDDKDRIVRSETARAMGDAFGLIPDKTQAWQDLDRLTKDDASFVRSRSLHSLGRASIFQATEAENNDSFRANLIQAIDFFERSSKASMLNPARFCLPFYRTFYYIMFQGREAQYAVDYYMKEAKNAIEQSKNKEILFEAIESLSQALINVQNAKYGNIQDKQLYLETMKGFCDRAAGLISEADDQNPGAAKTLYRGLDIIKQNIKSELGEIEANSFRLLEATRHTPFESITTRTADRISELSDIEFGFNVESIMDCVVPDIRTMCSFLHPRSMESVCELKNWDTLDFEEKILLFKRAIILCANQMENFSNQIGDKDDQIAYLRGEVLARLESVSFQIFRANIRSGDVAQTLRALEYELLRIQKIKNDLDRLGQKLDNLGILQQKALQELQENAPRLIWELEQIIKKSDFDETGKHEVLSGWKQELLDKLQALKSSPEGATLDLAAALSSIISLVLTIYNLPH